MSLSLCYRLQKKFGAPYPPPSRAILSVVGVVDLSFSTSYTGERANEGFLIVVDGLLVSYVEGDCIAVDAY